MPRPANPRAVNSMSRLEAAAQARCITIYQASAPISTGRRPNRSASGPWTSCAAPNPAEYITNTSGKSRADAPRSRSRAGQTQRGRNLRGARKARAGARRAAQLQDLDRRPDEGDRAGFEPGGAQATRRRTRLYRRRQRHRDDEHLAAPEDDGTADERLSGSLDPVKAGF